jgi:hypothetical protein
MTDVERAVINTLAAKAGLGILDLLNHLKSAISLGAERVAAALQADSDEATAAAEADDNPV